MTEDIFKINHALGSVATYEELQVVQCKPFDDFEFITGVRVWWAYDTGSGSESGKQILKIPQVFWCALNYQKTIVFLKK